MSCCSEMWEHVSPLSNLTLALWTPLRKTSVRDFVRTSLDVWSVIE